MKIIQIIPVINLQEGEDGHVTTRTSVVGLGEDGNLYYYIEEIGTWKNAQEFYRERKVKKKFLELAEKEIKLW